MSISKSMLLFFLILIFGSNSFFLAQQKEAKSRSKNKQDNYVFDVFLINGHALGYTLLKYSKSELRILMDLSATYNSSDEDRKFNSSSGTNINNNEYTSELDGDSHSVNLALNYLMEFYKSHFGIAYFGFGPFLGYSSTNSSGSNTRDEGKSEYSYSQIKISVGLTFLIGVRSELTKSISIFAEAQVNGGKSWNESEENVTNPYETYTYKHKDITEGKEWFYNFNYARIGLRFSL